MDVWEILAKKIKDLVEENQKLRNSNKMYEQRIKAIEMEFEAIKSLRAERDILKSEKETVKQRVKEMVDQLEQMELQ